MTIVPPAFGDDDSHVSAEVLAQLAEGHSRERVRKHAIEHLARCRTCMSAYADTVRYRAAWLAFPDAFGDSVRRGGLPLEERRTQRIGAPWIAAACVALVLAGLAGTLTVRARSRPPRPAEVIALLERASAEGLVFPGGEAGATRSETRYRSAPVIDPSADRALERLRASYEQSPGAPFDIYLLAAGLLASGRTDLAHDYIIEGRRRAPDDHRLPLLAAIAARRSGDLSEAERLLKEALLLAPGDPVATLDLGLVIAEARGEGSAAIYLDEVIRRAPRSPLAERARRVQSIEPTP